MSLKMKGPIKLLLAKTAPLLNIPYIVQLQMKEKRCTNSLKMFASLLKKSSHCPPEFLDQLSKHKGLPCNIDTIKPSLLEEGYRNKIGASVGFDADGNLAVGHVINMKKNRQVVISQLTDKINMKKHIDIIKTFEQFIKQHSEFVPDPSVKLNNWTCIMVRSNRLEQSMVHINFSGGFASKDLIDRARQELMDKYLQMLTEENIYIHSLYWQYNNPVMSVSEDFYPSELVFGEKYLTETLCDKIFNISPRSFFQVNTAVAELLYENTKQLIAASLDTTKKRRLILDLCCGTGTIGVILSDIAEKVISVDRVISSIEAARLNALSNNVHNIDHVCRDVEDFLSEFITNEEGLMYDDIVAVINPDRVGLTTRFCRKLRQCKALNTILYLSCRFEGQPTRNLYRLCKLSNSRQDGKEFRLTNVVPLDPFPHTRYVELILKLVR